MPFKSEKQRKWMWANDPEMAQKWEDEEDKNEGRIMKISKTQLRKIIREALPKTLIKESGVFLATAKTSPMPSRADPAFAAAIKGQPLNILSDYLGSLRATQLWFHAAHNLTKGTGFAGDHVNLYGQMYLQLQEDFDVAVEKAIGLTQDENIGCPIKITSDALNILQEVPSPSGMPAADIAITALAFIQNHIRVLTEIFSSLEESGSLPLGLNDFLAASANRYDTYVYLLAQRIKEG